MTIPVAPVSIHPQYVPPQQTPEVELLLQALQHRQALTIEREKLRQQQQQFELNKRLQGPALEATMLENMKRKRDLQEHDDDLKAQDQALQLYTGNLPRLHDMQGWGEVMAGVKDPRIAGHLMDYIKEGFQTAALEQRPTYTLAGTSPEGRAITLETRSGTFKMGGPILQRGGAMTSALREKILLGSRNAARAIRQAVALVRHDPDANFKPVLSDIAGSAAESRIAEYIPGLKGAAGYARRRAMSANQNKFQNLLNIVAHNSVGLLPGSRQSLVLFQNLRDSYSTSAGDPPELRAQKLALLEDLGRSLEALAQGQDISLAHLPGFEEFEPLGMIPENGQGMPTLPGTTVTPITPRYHPQFHRP